METDTTASPPSYSEVLSYAADDLLRPVILVLDGQFIHAESDPTINLYHVNRGIAHLGPATSIVEFARLEPSVSGAKQRSRHIYNLHHRSSLLRVPSARHAEYFIQAVAAPSRRLGHLGFKEAALTEHWTALLVDIKGCTELDQPPFVADSTPLFQVHHRNGAYKWIGSDSQDVAMEYNLEQEHRLLVTASLDRETLDALVALWCCRLWQRSVEQQRLQPVQTTSIASTLSHTLPMGWKKFR